MENKCPLCAKINPPLEWNCEACGAKLPLSGVRAPAPALTNTSSTTVAAPSKSPLAPRQVATTSTTSTVTAVSPPPPLTAPTAQKPDLASQFPVRGPVQAPQNAPTRESAPTLPGSGAPKVWVNSKTGIYHYPGGRWYGNTSEGFYTSESDALAKGNRASER